MIDVAEGIAITRLVKLNYTLATEEAERVGVDHVAKMSNVGSGTESLGKISDILGIWSWSRVAGYFCRRRSLRFA